MAYRNDYEFHKNLFIANMDELESITTSSKRFNKIAEKEIKFYTYLNKPNTNPGRKEKNKLKKKLIRENQCVRVLIWLEKARNHHIEKEKELNGSK